MTIEVGGGGGGFPQLAPDLNYIANIENSGSFATPYLQTAPVNAAAGLVTAISLSGKYIFSALQIFNAVNESYTIKLTIDGDVKWNSSKVLANQVNLLGAINSVINTQAVASLEPYEVKSTLLLEVQSTTDTTVVFNYVARSIL